MILRLLFVSLLSCSCQPWINPSPPPPQTQLTASTHKIRQAPAQQVNTPTHTATPQQPKQETQPLACKIQHINDIKITTVQFDSRSHKLIVADQSHPGSTWSTSEEAASAHNGLAAINGGFFTPEGKPLGLVVSHGNKIGYLNKASSLGSAIFLGGTKPQLIDRSQFTTTNNRPNLLQAGPRLVWNGLASKGLSNREKRPRSFLAWDGKNHWSVGHANSATLSSLAIALAKNPSFKYVMNLDGGRSSDLWVSSKVKGGGHSLRQFWNKDVRNYLVLTTR